LLTQINNTKAAKIMNDFRKGDISKAKANYELQKIGARQEGLGILQRDITPEKGLASAKKETVKLFRDAYANNPEVVKDIAKKLNLAGFRCDKANGGVCDNPRAYRKSMQETMQKARQGDNAAIRKIQNLGKTMNKFRGAAKATGYGVLIEIGLAPAIATIDWARGANKQEIVSNLTLGLFGRSMDEQLRDKDIRYKQISELEDAGIAEDKARSNLQTQGSYRSYAQNLQRLEDKMAKTDKAAIPFLRPNPQLEAGQMFDQDKYFVDIDYRADELKKAQEAKRQRSLQRVPRPGAFDYLNQGLASGGIASLPGVRQGPAPLSGPLPDGLPFVPNRVTKI
jgi:hypothetical protein